MKLRIFAEDKPAEKVFEYQLELADQTILLSTALLSGAIASVSYTHLTLPTICSV